jgi:hypothetical protein
LAKATSLTIDLRKIIRSRKPEKRQTRLAVRPDIDLISASDIAGRGRQVFVPDTNIYIMDAAGLLPQAAETLVDQGLMFHCSICLAEISVGVGKYAPKAAKNGLPVLTDNKADFDLLQQLAPGGRFIFV